MRLTLILFTAVILRAQPSPAEQLIEAGHWKRARTLVEARMKEAPGDALANLLLSQIRGAFGDRSAPLTYAEKAVELDGRTAKYHRQIAEVLGVTAQHAGALQQLFLARRFRREIDLALACDPRDVQSLRDLVEYYLLAPGIAGGDARKAAEVAARIGAIDAAAGLLAQARIAEHEKLSTRESLLRRAAAHPNYAARIALAHYYLEAAHTDFTASETAARAAIALNPERVDGYTVLAVVYAERHEWQQLDDALSEAARAVPDDATPHFRAAERLLAKGQDTPRAERYLRFYLAREPEGNQPTLADAAQALRQVRAIHTETATHAEGQL